MPSAFSDVRTLIVDDNIHIQRIVSAILRSFGFNHIMEASTAEEGLDILSCEPCDLLIVDDNLPTMTGAQMTHKIRTGQCVLNPYMPVIMLSAYSSREKVLQARDAGINDYCTKPISAKLLYEKIANVNDNPRPFVKSRNYTGPCRRRRKSKPNESLGLNRRASDVELWD